MLILLDVKRLAEKLKINTNKIRELRKENDFPKGVQIAGKKIVWIESEIDEWVISRLRIK